MVRKSVSTALAAMAILGAAPCDAMAVDSFVSVERFLDMEEEERLSFTLGAIDAYTAVGGAGLYRSRDFAIHMKQTVDCVHKQPVDELLGDIVKEAEREQADKAARIAMASALPRYLRSICEDPSALPEAPANKESSKEKSGKDESNDDGGAN